MSWTPREVGELLALAEGGALSGRQLAQAGGAGPLAPARGDWLAAADRLLAFAGALLLGAGLIFFFAYNWDELHRFAKIGLALAALAGCTGVAFFAAPFGTVYRAALLGACIATGALLALIGQTYQTGADVWELFVAWAALTLPLAALSRSSGAWTLWLAVANAGLLRGLSESAWFRFLGALGEPASIFAIAGFNLAVLAVFECFGGRLLAAPQRHLHRLAALGVVVPLAIGAAIGWWEDEYLKVSFAFLATALAATWLYYAVRRDVAMLALCVFAAIGVFTSGLLRVMPQEADFLLLNALALFVIVTTGFAAVWLTRLYKEGRTI